MKLLIIRFSSIGDIVLTTPVIRCLKKQVKDVEIHYLTKAAYQSLLSHNPYIDKLHLFDGYLPPVITALKAEEFDMVIDLHRNQRTWWVKQRLGVEAYVFPKLNVEKWMMVKFKRNNLPDVHIVDRYFSAIEHLEVVNDKAGLDYFVPPEDEILIAGYFPQIGSQPYVAFSMGGQHATKRLPNHKIVEICRKLKMPVILLGGKEDEKNGQAIEKKVKRVMVVNGCGAFNINQSASIVKQAAWVITHDTGLMHIAAAMDKKIIAIWGNTIPAFGMYPYPKNKKSFSKNIEIKDLECRPCSKIGHDKCPQKHFKCMEDIDVDEVVNAIK